MPPDHSWAHRTPNLIGLSYRFAVRTDDARLGRLVDGLLAGLRDPDDRGPVDHWYSLTASEGSDGTVDVRRDGDDLARGQLPGDAVGWVVWDVNRSAAEAGARHLLFHAGALEAGGTGVLVPGASGSGKSTLAAGLARAGLGYLTDELAALDLASGRLLPYAKPITVKPGSFVALADMDPGRAPGHDRAAGPWSGEEWQVAVGERTGRRIGGPCEPGLVIVPRYDPAAVTELTPLSDTEAFFALALHAVNLLPHGAAGSEALGRLAARCRCFALSMSDLDEACRLVLALVAETAAAPARGEGLPMPAEWPDGASVPARREGASAVELDDNLALYDEVGQLLILLNASAAVVWELCDGATSIDDMVRALVEVHRDDPAADAEVIGEDVRLTVRKLADLGLVVDAGAGAGSAPG